MFRVCKWFHEEIILGEIEPLEDKSKTDALCLECLRRIIETEILPLGEVGQPVKAD